MKGLLKKWYVLIFSSLSVSGFAQDVAIGHWKSYAPYRNAVSITQNAESIFFATELSIISLEKDGSGVTFTGKESGLSDANITRIKHSPTDDVLVVAYANSNVDLIKEGKVINLNFIQTNTTLSGDRSITDIYFDGKTVYLSTAFGVVFLDVENAEFQNTVFTGIPVKGTIALGEFVYSATEEGVYRVNKNGIANLVDFGQWEYLGEAFGFPTDYSTSAIELFNGQMYLGLDNALFRYDGDALHELYSIPGFDVAYLSEGTSHLIAGFECHSGCTGRVIFSDVQDEIIEAGNGCVGKSFEAIQVGQEIYFADLFSDLKKASAVGMDCEQFSFSSPGSRNVSDIETDGDNIYIASGGRTENGSNADLGDGLFFFEEGRWNNYNQFNVAAFGDNSADRDFINIAEHPTNNNIYIGNYYGGLIEFDGSTWQVFNADNSSLQGVVGFEERVRVGSLAFDSKGNLWMTNHLAEKPISVLLADGSWRSFGIPGGNAVQNISVDAFDNKWITIYGSSTGIVVLNEGDINTDADDQIKTFNASNSELTSNQVNYIAVDLDGVVWAGTSEGVITFECGGDIFRESCKGTQRIVDVGSNRDLLLRTEEVKTIGVDGANRKWFGTTNGVFVQSPDGEDEVFRFNTENSPLYADNVVDFAFDNTSGEVFIGTTAGVQSYRSNATEGPIRHTRKAKVFPNPVRPTFQGDIAISGLARNANVKITDVKGQLVYETEANGGTALWNGNDFNGRRVASGVYMIFSTIQDDFGKTDALVGKMLFVN